ncbi:MAG: glycosyltransferase family 2 protein [Planctomycetota bacterium]|jgi:glycosyltransferase involved in cell wall biosynthesis
MDVSVIIPTHGRPRKAAECVRALAAQTLEPDRYEVLVGLDGPDPDTERAVTEAWPDPPPGSLRVVTCRRAGYNAVRNELLAMCRGRTLVSLNDDVRPGTEFLDVHLAEQQRGAEAGRPAIVVGLSPWVPSTTDRLFDRLVRETSMVFFYDRMDDADPDHDWGFRHAWGLNVSMPAGAVSAVGGWTAFPLEYGYDDIEIAWRLRERFGARVLYRRSALAPHDHRYDPRGYLEREFKLGRSAWNFALGNPEFARDVFGRNVVSKDEIAYSRAFIRHERATAARIMASFERLADMPATIVDGPHAETLVKLIYEQHLPLKRWMWRAGLLAAAEGRPIEDVTWPQGTTDDARV